MAATDINGTSALRSCITLENLFSIPEGRQLLSCVQCGTCVATCPYGDVSQYPPRRIIQMLRTGFLDKVLESDSILNCVACYACEAKCPRGLSLTSIFLPLIKEQVLSRLSEIPAEFQRALENTLRYGNPMGESPRRRSAWIKTSKVPIRILGDDPRPTDVLWHVECYLSYHRRGQDTARATAKVLHALGVDFAILGQEEECAGECGRLAWERGLYDELMEHNLAVFRKYHFKSIVTSCPHAYDAFRSRYTDFGFNYPLQMMVPYLAQSLTNIKPLLVRNLNHVVTLHDSCCMGRHNKFFDEPRALLAAIPGTKIVEMVHNRDNTMCCGGGGGGMWLDTYYKTKGYERLSDRRIKEAVATGADVLAVTCPYEVSRFEDALKVLGFDKRVMVRDVIELVADAMGD
jgi:dimethylglycine catabolism B